MEVVAAAASVTGILTAVGHSIEYIVKLREFYGALSSASRTVDRFLHGINSLLQTLHSIQELLERWPPEKTDASLASMRVQVEDCSYDLFNWLSTAKNMRTGAKGGGKAWFRRFLVAVNRNEVNDIRSEIDRHRSALNSSLAVIGRSLDIDTFRHVDNITAKIDGLSTVPLLMQGHQTQLSDMAQFQDFQKEEIVKMEHFRSANIQSSAGSMKSLQTIASSLSRIEDMMKVKRPRAASHQVNTTDLLFRDWVSNSDRASVSSEKLARPASSLRGDIPPSTQSLQGQTSLEYSYPSQMKHKCRICDRRFTRLSSLQTHMHRHQNVHQTGSSEGWDQERLVSPGQQIRASELEEHASMMPLAKSTTESLTGKTHEGGSWADRVFEGFSASFLAPITQGYSEDVIENNHMEAQDRFQGVTTYSQPTSGKDPWVIYPLESAFDTSLGETVKLLPEPLAKLWPEMAIRHHYVPMSLRAQFSHFQLEVLEYLRGEYLKCEVELSEEDINGMDKHLEEKRHEIRMLQGRLESAEQDVRKAGLVRFFPAVNQALSELYPSDYASIHHPGEPSHSMGKMRDQTGNSHEMFELGENILDSNLLGHWLGKRDRVNRWLLHSMLSDGAQSDLHRSMTNTEDLDEPSWVRSVLRYWFVDEAATGFELAASLSGGAVDSRTGSSLDSSESSEYRTCIEEDGAMLSSAG